MMSVANQLHEYLLLVTHELRNMFQANNQSHMHFSIEVAGRPDGNLTFAYHLGKYGSDVKGNNLTAVRDEFLRREGWDKRHDPICLPPS